MKNAPQFLLRVFLFTAAVLGVGYHVATGDDRGPTRQHWAYVPPKRPAVPPVRRTDWPGNAIDYFILSRLEREGLEPSPEADRYTLIRRLTLDLTGLPPTIEEADAFASDQRPDAYGRLVDRLLASPAYGEQMARHWLDVARYADSHGYHIDTPRQIWAYRDWVIKAFNRNQRFDEFTIEQLAGDLLPNATLEQKVATGFNRNTMFNEEGGIDEEEFRTKAVVDRVNTTMTAWMSATIMCAECHDHKYDPLTQAEFYRLYAFFNNVPETGGGFLKKPVPQLELPAAPEVEEKIKSIRDKVGSLRRQREMEAKSLQENFAVLWDKEIESGLLPVIRRLRTMDSITKQISPLEAEQKKLEKQRPTTMVMKELPQPRQTRIHIRGNFLDKGKAVEPGVPAVFHSLTISDKGRPSRLDLARWLVDPKNPLTARVTVNRYWQMLFSAGLVRTPEEFGTRGEPPSHPELLDWLATEFIRSGWDIKGMIRLLVTSATYRQSSRITPRLLEKDPENRLLGRGPRFRLDAEGVRDTALAVSGLLNGKIGGPSVYPYQPAGLWEEKGLGSWPMSKGRDLYRRSLYTYWRRSVPYPTFATFDAPSREYCVVARPRSNTPLQAFVTLNAPQFAESARVFAERIIADGGRSETEQVVYAFRRTLARPPADRERDLLVALYRERRAYFENHKSEAVKLAAYGQAPALKGAQPAEVAAWTVVANALLSLDETITRN